MPYVAGSIEIFVVEGCDGDALLRTYGFAEFRHKYDCPCTPVQLAAGLDRAFIVTVPFGSEKATVVRLAGDRGSFRYVGLVWVDQTSLA